MLSIYIGHMEGEVGNPDVLFDNKFDMSLMVENFPKKVVSVIDKSEVIGEYSIKSPYLGVMSPTLLSSGAKSLILLNYCPGKVINNVWMGDNCLPILFDMAMKKDITISMSYCTCPYNYGYAGGVRILNNGTIINNSEEFFDVWEEFEER